MINSLFSFNTDWLLEYYDLRFRHITCPGDSSTSFKQFIAKEDQDQTKHRSSNIIQFSAESKSLDTSLHQIVNSILHLQSLLAIPGRVDDTSERLLGVHPEVGEFRLPDVLAGEPLGQAVGGDHVEEVSAGAGEVALAHIGRQEVGAAEADAITEVIDVAIEDVRHGQRVCWYPVVSNIVSHRVLRPSGDQSGAGGTKDTVADYIGNNRIPI